jgi:hypothetical protein
LVDPLREHDLDLARHTPPAAKLTQALDLMQTGIRLKRAALRHRHPAMSERELDEALERWLTDDA